MDERWCVQDDKGEERPLSQGDSAFLENLQSQPSSGAGDVRLPSGASVNLQRLHFKEGDKVLRLRKMPNIGMMNPYSSREVPDNTPTGALLRWMWWSGDGAWVGDDPESWTLYEDSISKKLTDGWRNWQRGQCDAVYKWGNDFQVDFNIMMQQRQRDLTKVRDVRFVVIQWMWDKTDYPTPVARAGPDAEFEPYEWEQALVLEKSFVGLQADCQVKAANGVIYDVDLVEMCQFRSDNRFFRREVKRKGPDLTARQGRDQGLVNIGGKRVDLLHLIPDYWAAGLSDEHAQVRNLKPEDRLYQQVQGLMSCTVAQVPDYSGRGLNPKNRLPPKGFKVVRVELLENVRLWKEYAAARERLRKKHEGLRLQIDDGSKYLERKPLKTTLLDSSLNEYFLFHGTGVTEDGNDILQSICRQGFAARMARADGLLGPGLYFSDLSSKANQYVPCPECRMGTVFRDDCRCGPERVQRPYRMLIARVMLGRVHICKNYEPDDFVNLPRPEVVRSQNYDSILAEGRFADPLKPVKEGDEDKHLDREVSDDNPPLRELVVYESRHAFPEFIVYYFRE